MMPRKRLVTVLSWLCAAVVVLVCGRTIFTYLLSPTFLQGDTPKSVFLHRGESIKKLGLAQSFNSDNSNNVDWGGRSVRAKRKRDDRRSGRERKVPPAVRVYAGVYGRGKTPGAAAFACRDTWGKSKQVANMEFFVSAPRQQSKHRDVVNLGAGGSSQVRLLLMLSHLCSHWAGRYDWFLLTSDSTYISVKELVSDLKENFTYVHMDGKDATKKKNAACVDAMHMVMSKKILGGICPLISKSCPLLQSTVHSDSKVKSCLGKISKSLCSKVKQISAMSHKTFASSLGKKVSSHQKTLKKIHLVHSINSVKDLNKIHALYQRPSGKRKKTALYFKKNAWKHHVR